jgi:nucleoside 2-deoxyribosyltransferase
VYQENYLAGGWFTEKQAKVYDDVCLALETNNLYDSFFIPKYLGVNLMHHKLEDEDARIKAATRVFAIDTGMMMYSIMRGGFTLAIIDDMDPGMLWELGALWGLTHGTHPIVTYTSKDYGLNVMIRMSVKAHIKGLVDLNDFLRNLEQGTPLEELMMDERYQNFGPELY